MYCEITLFIICSGSCIGIVYAKFFDIVFAGITFLILLKVTGKVEKRNTMILLLFYALYGASYINNREFMPNVNAYLSYMLRMFGTFCMLSIVSKAEFEKRFVRIMHLINVSGLIVFVLVVSTSLKNSLSYIGEFPVLGPFNFVKLSEGRNSCIFWEPGAYQFFLLYEMIIILRKAKWKLPHKKSQNIFNINYICLFDYLFISS